MYPLNVSLPAPQIGFAVANDKAEHMALSKLGYLPAYEKPAKAEKPADAPAAG